MFSNTHWKDGVSAQRGFTLRQMRKIWWFCHFVFVADVNYWKKWKEIILIRVSVIQIYLFFWLYKYFLQIYIVLHNLHITFDSTMNGKNEVLELFLLFNRPLASRVCEFLIMLDWPWASIINYYLMRQYFLFYQVLVWVYLYVLYKKSSLHVESIPAKWGCSLSIELTETSLLNEPAPWVSSLQNPACSMSLGLNLQPFTSKSNLTKIRSLIRPHIDRECIKGCNFE